MSTIHVILIPADKTKPVARTTYDSSDYTNLTALIFNGDRTGTFDGMTTAADGPYEEEITFWFDDNGLARADNEEIADIINLRAMQLYAHMTGMPLRSFAVPLIGDYVITGGADDEGESLDAPAWIMDFPFDWHNRYTMMKPEQN